MGANDTAALVWFACASSSGLPVAIWRPRCALAGGSGAAPLAERELSEGIG